MTEKDSKVARIKLDEKLRPFRVAARGKAAEHDLLRAVRQALRVPVKEIAGKMGVNRSGVFDLELRERRKTITLRSLERMAGAMGCRVV